MLTDGELKQCSACGKHLSLTSFYDQARNPDGKEYSCKECRRAKARQHARSPASLARYRARPIKYRKSAQERYRADPQRWAARLAAQKRSKQMKKLGQAKICEVCGEPGQLHHDDYSKPDEMRLLCAKHHGETHRQYV